MTHTPLLAQRRFSAIFSCMALTAFNDNYYKNALTILITYVLAQELGKNAALLISIASACFIVPFFLFSGFAGTLADKYSKQKLVRVLKSIEVLLFAGAGAAIISHQIVPMMVMLFLLGALAAFFGPVKYAILPELLHRDEILPATGLVEGGTYVAILLGTLAGSLLVMVGGGVYWIAGGMLVAAILGLFAARAVPDTPASNPTLKVNYNIFSSVWEMLKVGFVTPGIFAAILGISWFWSVGATYLIQLAVFTKDVVGGSEQVVSLYMAIFTVGIAVGSFACSRLVARMRQPSLLPPLALVGVMLCGLDLCLTGYGMPAPSGVLIGLGGYFSSFAHYRLVADLVIMAFCGGVFIVPLYARLQTDSVASERARVIAGNNVMNALFIATASLLAAALYALQLEVREVLLIFALLNVPVIAVLWNRRGTN